MARHSFRDQVVLVTGASEGIGRELALQLAAEGAALALASRGADRLQEVVKECGDRGGRALAIPTDVSEPEACRRFVEQALAAYGRIDMLINNAGISMWARFADVRDPEMLDRIMRVNFHGSVYCTYYALPHLRQARGRIVVVSSIGGLFPGPGATAYVASKYALRGFFDSLRIELRPDNVSVTVVYPGFVRTGIFGRFFDATGNYAPDMSSRIPRFAMMPVDKCARRILDAARRRRGDVVPTIVGRLIVGLSNRAPWLMDWFWHRMLRWELPPAKR